MSKLVECETVVIGTSPAGVEWIAYRRRDESDADFAEKVSVMTARLAARNAKWAAVLARTGTYEERLTAPAPAPLTKVHLTKGEARWLDYSMQNVPEQDGLEDGEWGKLSAGYVAGATFVRGTVEDLDVLANAAANILESDDHVDAVGAPEGSALWNLNLERAERCLRSIVAKLSRPSGSKE